VRDHPQRHRAAQARIGVEEAGAKRGQGRVSGS
jgi:hypothetical protein